MLNYVQIGSNIGADFFAQKINNLTERCNVYLFEPNTILIDQLTENYKHLSALHNVSIISKGVVADKTINKLHVYKQAPTDTMLPNYGLTSILHRKSYDNVLATIPMDTITFHEFCKEYNIEKIELLMIDTEGYDYEILNSIDLESIDIKLIMCEHWGDDGDDMDNTREIRTGATFFANVIIPKYEKYYSISMDKFDEIPNDIFKKIAL